VQVEEEAENSFVGGEIMRIGLLGVIVNERGLEKVGYEQWRKRRWWWEKLLAVKETKRMRVSLLQAQRQGREDSVLTFDPTSPLVPLCEVVFVFLLEKEVLLSFVFQSPSSHWVEGNKRFSYHP
jgi:hypothetical protein